MKSNIALIGFMGVGKSTIGRLLAEKLHMQFCETDALVEDQAGKPIAEIFKKEGENVFREIESKVTVKTARKEKVIISCGGGVVLNPSTVDQLKENALIIYLMAKPSSILQRVQQSKEIRPLLEVPDRAKTINDLMELRRPIYEQSADIILDTSDLTPEEVVNDIMAELVKYESCNLQK